MLDIKKGDRLTITYPTTTHVRFVDSARWQARRIECLAIRDLLREPLTPDEFLRRPYILRSRWLIRAADRDSRQLRQFYLGSSHEFASPASLRIGIYEPGDSKPSQWIGREFGETANDRRQLVQLVLRLGRQDLSPASLRITAPDLRLISA